MQQLTFLVPGFSKCGTTTLCSLLDEHPEIKIASVKEPNFFCREDYEDGWLDYEKLFADHGGATAFGEGSTFYSTVQYEQITRENVKRHYPDIKLIFIARDPISRIESSIREYHHSGPLFGFNMPFEIEQALRQFPDIIHCTLYWSRLKSYMDYFPQEQIHTLCLEDLKSQPAVELEKCFRFLGVDSTIRIGGVSRQLNAGSIKLYDTRLLRLLRTNRFTEIPLSKVPMNTQDRIFSRLGLRRRFKQPIQWRAETLRWVFAQLHGDVSAFLDYAGKKQDYWKRYSQLLQSAQPELAGQRTGLEMTR